MHKEITSTGEFDKLSEKVKECHLKRLSNITNLKLRTTSTLYTMKLETKGADELLAELTRAKTEL